MTNKTEWTYCPECGCEDVRHEEGEHKQCASCHQEWFSSVDYSDVVRKHLSGKYIDKDAQIERLRAELGQCKGEYDRAVNKVDAMRDQLAEAHALFSDVLSIDIPRTAQSLERMRSILSGSAEPAPIAWHVGGNGYDEVYFSYPAWASKLGDACPAINAINDVSTLAILFRGGSIVSKGRAEPANKEIAQ